MKKGIKKGVNIATWIVLVIFIIVGLSMLTFTIMSKKSGDGGVSVGGYQLRKVLTASMEKYSGTDVSQYKIKDLPVNSLLVVQDVPEKAPKEFYDNIKVGDVLTFRYYLHNKVQIITHRVIDIQPKDDGYIIELKGDNLGNNDSISSQIIDTTDDNPFKQVIGKVVYVNKPLGVIINFLQGPIGIIFIIIIPSMVIILTEIIKVYKIVSKNGKKSKKQALKELEELKSKLSQLETKDTSESQAKQDQTE